MAQEITTRSWGSRIVNAFVGILVGIALIIGSFILIFWNEGNGLHTAQSLKQAQQVLISVPNSPIDLKNNLRVVYLSGLATTDEILKDNTLGISKNAIKLDRKVEIYQWQEESKTDNEKQVGGSEKQVTTYSYKKIWSTDFIDSSEFKEQEGHQNPTTTPIKSKDFQANHVTVGDFSLPEDLISEINNATSFDLSEVNIDNLEKKLKKSIHQESNGLYVGSDPQTPNVGDLRITVSVVLPQTVSIIAQQVDNTFQPYKAPSGKSVSLLETGQHSSEEMIANAMSQNKMITWLLRGLSLILMIIGIALLMQPLVVLADVVPFIGSIVGVGTGVVAFIVGLLLWTIGIAIAWFAVRPLWAIGLIAIALVICYLVWQHKHKKLSA